MRNRWRILAAIAVVRLAAMLGAAALLVFAYGALRVGRTHTLVLAALAAGVLVGHALVYRRDELRGDD